MIEAHYLFDIPFDRIETVLHPQSIVHSMVEFQDGAVMAQLGSADMRLPIQYALMGPDRPRLEEENRLDMTRTMTLEFREMDFDRFPILKTAYEAGRQEEAPVPCSTVRMKRPWLCFWRGRSCF